MKQWLQKGNRVINLMTATYILFHEVGAEVYFTGTDEPYSFVKQEADIFAQEMQNIRSMIRLSQKYAINFAQIQEVLVYEYGAEVRFIGTSGVVSLSQREAEVLRAYIMRDEFLIKVS